MNTQEILSILRGEQGINPNRGIEEDDLLEMTFFELPKTEHDAFWAALAEAMTTLLANNDDLPLYLACRFIFSMSEIKPPHLPHKINLFAFLLDEPTNSASPFILAGRLLALLVLNKGDEKFWKRQVDASLDSLEAAPDNSHAMAAVVYAFLGCNGKASISAEQWGKLFIALTRLPELPRMELLELLVGVEKESSDQPLMKEELDLGMDALRTSSKNTNPDLASVFRAWLDKNEPRQAIADWLSRELSPHEPEARKMSPRHRITQIMNSRRAAA